MLVKVTCTNEDCEHDYEVEVEEVTPYEARTCDSPGCESEVAVTDLLDCPKCGNELHPHAQEGAVELALQYWAETWIDD